ncbi:MAG: carboxypeptidase-like regulatory domain-containing protein [Longimicrobiales bacterium]
MPFLDNLDLEALGSRAHRFGIKSLAVLLCGTGALACGSDDPMTAATPSVAGVVMADGVGLAGVTVTLQSQLMTTTTDPTGRFEFFDVAAGDHTLSVMGLPTTVYCADMSFSINVSNPETTLSQDFGCTESPTMMMVEGNWSYTLTPTSNTCGELAAPFTLPAVVSINSVTSTDLDVLFAAPALPITGPYTAPSFSGTTSGFDLGDGFTSTESWVAEFLFNAGNPEMTGESTVLLTDAENTVLCTLLLDVVGQRVVS